MPRHCLTLDLQNDPKKIAEYKRYHEKIWPEIRDSLFAAGVIAMEIYLHGTRMFMIMDVSRRFFAGEEGRPGPRQPQGSGVGSADGELPGRARRSRPGAPLGANGEGLRPRQTMSVTLRVYLFAMP